jgi:hypothetical protein
MMKFTKAAVGLAFAGAVGSGVVLADPAAAASGGRLTNLCRNPTLTVTSNDGGNSQLVPCETDRTSSFLVQNSVVLYNPSTGARRSYGPGWKGTPSGSWTVLSNT